MNRHRTWVIATLLNAVLAFSVQAIAPAEPTLSDREKYDFVGRHAFATDCTLYYRLYCYRVLVPAMLERVPIDAEIRWRAYRWAAITAAGTVVSLTAASLSPSPWAAALAAVLAQASYGFAFTGYDPYSPDPAVFVMLAVLAWCWLRDRWILAFTIGIAGIFAKETVAIMSAATALAALLPPRRRSWMAWVAQGTAVVFLLFFYRWLMQTFWGWDIGPAASLVQNDLVAGGWLSLWLRGNTLATQLFLVFAIFGCAWVFAILGLRDAPSEWRNLALGSALPFLALNWVQNPERALGNLFFVVVPLAAIALARVPASLAVSAVLLNAIITARASTSSDWLPSAKFTLLPAAFSAGAVLWWSWRKAGTVADQGISRSG